MTATSARLCHPCREEHPPEVLRRRSVERHEGHALSATDEAKQLAVIAAVAAADKLATNVVAIDVSSHLALSDVFVVCSANNDRQLHAIVDNVEDELRKRGQKPLHREGARDGNWVLLDYPDFVVHVLLAEARDFYRLERLWNDCPVVEIPELARDSS